ncbi:uncharacterized protein CEXT_634981 [Caerostris extrusa]|uniref:Uncharacterized protein n=1 Tax=Caerostris extrusa TaxID=172846 RepID=A0AAV4W198_CAEEX|nr:uncharacterized protein CEXT_634981 [Caerostris extrusa]
MVDPLICLKVIFLVLFGTSEDSKYQGFQYASKYIDPSTASEASEWEGASQGVLGTSTQIFCIILVVKYSRLRIIKDTGGLPYISERDIENWIAYRQTCIKPPPQPVLRRQKGRVQDFKQHSKQPFCATWDLGALSADSTSTFDPDSYKLSSYDEFAKVSDLITDTLDLSDDSLRFASDVATSAKVRKTSETCASYSNIGSWSESSASPKGA